jgi:hypothetical protein
LVYDRPASSGAIASCNAGHQDLGADTEQKECGQARYDIRPRLAEKGYEAISRAVAIPTLTATAIAAMEAPKKKAKKLPPEAGPFALNAIATEMVPGPVVNGKVRGKKATSVSALAGAA